ncbi:MAG TPA: substrate-binding domain-containing protein [Terracidiphilus sp.]|nr:substrate-binding domain-containing protein [Terracidiphilus sp.]
MKQLLSLVQRTAAFAAALFLIGISVEGCTGSRRPVVEVIPSISSDAQWLSLHVGVVEAADKAGLEAHWSGPSEESNSSEQIKLVDQAIERKAFGIVLEPNALVATNKVIRKAQSHHIPVVVIAEGTGTPEGEHLYHLLNDTSETGNLIATRTRQLIHGEGDIAILGLRSEIPGNIERADAIADALRLICPNLQVIKRSMESSSTSYEQHLVREFIHSHPRVKEIVALSSQESFAVAAAVRSENAMQRIKIIGCDQTLPLFLMLRAGAIDSLVVQDMRTMGRLAVEIVTKDRAGLQAPQVSVVKPVLISKENIDTEPIQQVILMHKEVRR